ncbi:MAG: fibronectin type III domain-containing protein [Chloroflexota bacterium]|nr:fibronectin type III domain-containing protein [Chloroflexota bacterium]
MTRRRLWIGAAVTMLAAVSLWAANVSAQTPACSIALTVTSPQDHWIHGEWTTSNCPTLKGQYEWKQSSDTVWKNSHVTTARNGVPNRFHMKDLTPGSYDFRIATQGPNHHRIAIVSTSGADDTYGDGDVIRIRVTWGREVTVTGTPQLSIDMDPADWGRKEAAYASGSGGKSLDFTYTVASPNFSSQGIAVLANSLTLNGGTIRHADGSDAWLGHHGIGHSAGHKVNHQTTSDGNDTVDPPPLFPEYSDVVTVAVKPVVGQPKNVRALKGAYWSLGVTWDAPCPNPTLDTCGKARYEGDAPPGTNFTGWFVEWKGQGEAAWQRSSKLPFNHRHHKRVTFDGGTFALAYTVGGLAEGTYTVRVIAEFTDSSSNVTEVVSRTVMGQTGYVEPMMVWWIDDTPNPNLDIGRIFMMVDTNYPAASAICTINGGNINCPPRTLVSLDFRETGVYNITAKAEENAARAAANPVTVSAAGTTGCRIPVEGTRVSGSNNKLVVWWSDVLCNDELSGPVVEWRIVHERPNGVGGVTTVVIRDIPASHRTYTFNNQRAGVHKISVVPVSEADHDFDEKNGVTSQPSDCATAGDEGCTVKPTARTKTQGMSQQYSTILHSSFTTAPEAVTESTASAGVRAIYLSWAIPESSRYYMGIEGYWPGRTDVHPNARSPIYKYDIRYRRAQVSSIAPGRWREFSTYPWYVGSADNAYNPRRATIDDLEDGLPYDVEIRAVSAAGNGPWSRVTSALRVN